MYFDDLLTTALEEMLTASRNTCNIFQKVVCHFFRNVGLALEMELFYLCIMISSSLHVPDVDLLTHYNAQMI